jgi:diguanylate cyclase (GGDEF)-like protein
MLTQDIVTVLVIALVVNALIVTALIAAPRIRDWVASRSAVVLIGSGRTDAGIDAGMPWFVAASANEASGTAVNGSSGGSARGSSGDSSRGEAGTELAAEPEAAPVPMPQLALPSVWATWLEEEAARAARYPRPVTIVLVELAGLDRLADRVGRAAADRLIPPVAATIRRHARAADRLARLSPTRFGVLLVETDEVQAINYVERVRGACDVWLASGAVSLRLSIGWAEIRPDRSVDASVREAEQRLFDDRRRSNPAEPAPATDGRDGHPAVLQPTAG